MKQTIAVFVLFTLMSAGRAFAVEQYYLSQVANGITGNSSFRTTFVLFNNSDTDLTVSLKLTGDSGDPLSVAIGGMGTRSEFNVFLSAGSTQVLQTDGSGALATGAATVSSPSVIGVSAIFGIYDATGNFITEAGVGRAPPMTDFVAPVDTTGLFNTGLALFNPGSGTATITAMLRDASGRAVDQATISLGANAHMARFVAGAGQLFPSMGGFRGTLWMHSSAPVSALVLRQNQEPLSYTSLPVVSSASTRTTLTLPQVVSGTFNGGSFRTAFLLFNLSSGAADATLSLTADDGSPLAVTIPGSGTRSSFALSLPAAGSAILQIDSSGPLTAGAATITSTAAIGAAAIFTVLDANGAFQTEAGVGDSPVMTALTLPVDIAPDFETGVAFFNPAGTAATISLKLLDSSGALFDPGAIIDLGAKSHTARFVSQLFPGTGNFKGSLAIQAPAGVAALTLRQNAFPLSYTTLPVIAGTSSGKAPQALLLSANQSGIDATADLTINKTLAYGFRLAGHIAGAARIIDVIAQRADGRTYSGVADPDTSRYLITVEQGTYTLRVCYDLRDVPGGTRVSLSHTDASPVVVAADMTRNITLPMPQLHAVTGRVSGLASLPERTDAAVVFTSSDNKIEGVFPVTADGSYLGSLPNGSYRVSVTIPLINFTYFQNQLLALYNIRLTTVSGGPVTADISIPATTRLTGSVRASWLGALAFGIQISALDRSAAPASDSECMAPPMISVAKADPSAQYQMLLTRDRTYSLGLTVPMADGAKRLGTLSFALAPDPLTAGGDATLAFNLPDLPGQVSIRGRVSNSQGIGLPGILVAASSKSVSGPAGIGFSTDATTDAQGNYLLTILSGKAYQLQFIAP